MPAWIHYEERERVEVGRMPYECLCGGRTTSAKLTSRSQLCAGCTGSDCVKRCSPWCRACRRVTEQGTCRSLRKAAESRSFRLDAWRAAECQLRGRNAAPVQRLLQPAVAPVQCDSSSADAHEFPASAQWLNSILTQMWPYYDPAICAAVKVIAACCRSRSLSTRSEKDHIMPGPKLLPFVILVLVIQVFFQSSAPRRLAIVLGRCPCVFADSPVVCLFFSSVAPSRKVLQATTLQCGRTKDGTSHCCFAFVSAPLSGSGAALLDAHTNAKLLCSRTLAAHNVTLRVISESSGRLNFVFIQHPAGVGGAVARCVQAPGVDKEDLLPNPHLWRRPLHHRQRLDRQVQREGDLPGGAVSWCDVSC